MRCTGRSTHLKRDAAAGVDGITWDMYGEGLDERLLDLHRRLHSGGAYRAPPVRRVEIPKPDGGTRPLGIAALEDKVVQKGGCGCDPDTDLRGGVSWLQLRVPTGAGGARCARCPGLRDRTAQGQLDSRCRPPGVLRHDPAGLVDHVPRASHRRQAGHPPDPEMAERWRHGRWIMDRRGHGHAAGGNSLPRLGERVPALRARPVVPQEMASERPGWRSDHRPLRRRYRCRVPTQAGCGAVPPRRSGEAEPGSVSVFTRTRPASWSLAGSR